MTKGACDTRRSQLEVRRFATFSAGNVENATQQRRVDPCEAHFRQKPHMGCTSGARFGPPRGMYFREALGETHGPCPIRQFSPVGPGIVVPPKRGVFCRSPRRNARRGYPGCGDTTIVRRIVVRSRGPEFSRSPRRNTRSVSHTTILRR
jgi:hypothetical protein